MRALLIQLGFEKIIRSLDKKFSEKYKGQISFLLKACGDGISIEVLENNMSVEPINLDQLDLEIEPEKIHEGFTEIINNMANAFDIDDPQLCALVSKDKVYTLLYDGKIQIAQVKIAKFLK